MASITFTRSSETRVSARITGCVASHTYSIQVYGNGSWWDKVTGLSGSTSYTRSFSVDTGDEYSARLWDKTIQGVGATGTIPAWTPEVETVSIRAECGDGVASFTISCNGVSKLVRATSGYTYMTVDSGSSVTISDVTPVDGYSDPYYLYYNTQSNPTGWDGPIRFTTSTVVTSTSFDRRLRVTGSRESLYPYTQKVYIDDSYSSSTTNNYYTDPTITIGDLSLYTKYSADYDFDYATVGSSTIKRNQYYEVQLSLNANTDIYLYFKSRPTPVKPTITRITTTQNSADVYWNANGGLGGNTGYWLLYYGVSSSSMHSVRLTDDSVAATVTGLEADTTYIFYIRHYVSGDYLQSSSMSATTSSAIGYFAWTNDDATKIQAGQPVTNLTATAWNNLISKVSACGGSTGSIPRATAGSTITAEHFNQMRNAISGLPGSGSVASSVTSGSTKMRATLFANATTALKEAINRAISTKNG